MTRNSCQFSLLVQEAKDAKKQQKTFSGDSEIELFVVYISGSDIRSKVAEVLEDEDFN